jgi:hypothetical protein
LRRLAGLAAALALAGCAPQTAELPKSPVGPAPGVRVLAEAVPEGPPGYINRLVMCERSCPGTFTYAGGVALTSPDTSRFHGLSDLEVLADGRMVAVGDEGDLVRGRILLDASGRLTGLADVTLVPLTGRDSRPLSGGKADSDAESLALWPNGDLMVGFERNHRIWLYPAKGGPPRPVPHPNTAFPENDGMEALAIDAAAGPDAYLVGREDTRETWTCQLTGGCTPAFKVATGGPPSLVSARPLPGGRWAFVLRDFKPLVGNTVELTLTDARGRILETLEIKRPATVDNFEGVAALPRPDGTIRFYLISDDNFSGVQRTLLLAWDWSPAH